MQYMHSLLYMDFRCWLNVNFPKKNFKKFSRSWNMIFPALSPFTVDDSSSHQEVLNKYFIGSSSPSLHKAKRSSKDSSCTFDDVFF